MLSNSSMTVNSYKDTSQDDHIRHWIKLIYRILILFFGTYSNSLVIFTTLYCRALRTSSNILAIQVALANLLICMTTVAPYIILSPVVTGNWSTWLDSHCGYLGVISISSIFVSNYLYALVALDRYIRVVRNTDFTRKLFTSCHIVIFVMICWIFAFAYGGTLILLETIRYNSKTEICGYTPYLVQQWIVSSLNVFGLLVQVLPTLITVSFCYIAIARHYRRSKKIHTTKLCRPNNVDSSKNDSRAAALTKEAERNAKQQITILKNSMKMLISFVVYSISWCPISMLTAFDFSGTVSISVYDVAVMLFLSHLLTMPIMYACISKDYRDSHRLAALFRWRELKQFKR